MFSQVSVCPPGGLSAPLHAGIHTPRTRGRHPPGTRGRHPPGPEADTPEDQRQTPPGPEADTPPAQCMLGYGQQAGGGHPTGMHSCYTCVYFLITSNIKDDVIYCSGLKLQKLKGKLICRMIFYSFEVSRLRHGFASQCLNVFA